MVIYVFNVMVNLYYWKLGLLGVVIINFEVMCGLIVDG